MLTLALLTFRCDRAARRVQLKLWEVDGLDLDMIWAHVDDATIPSAAAI